MFLLTDYHCRDQVTCITGTITLPPDIWQQIYEIFEICEKYKCESDDNVC